MPEPIEELPIALISPDDRGRVNIKKFANPSVAAWRLYRSPDGKRLQLEAVEA